MNYPNIIRHWINGNESVSLNEDTFIKINPATGTMLARVALGVKEDVDKAIDAAENAYFSWGKTRAIERGKLIRKAVLLLEGANEELSEIISLECGKSLKSSLGEVEAAIECGYFFAGEGQRMYGKTLQSARSTRSVELIRESIGIGALFTPFNNPAASIAWKIFPALLCGNTVILKSHEYTPYTALFFAKIFKHAGIPDGVFNVLQGTGQSVGIPLVSDQRISFISFTGSSKTGADIVARSASRLPKISIEAGGKNSAVVCVDADLPRAAEAVISRAFVDGGQRCAATSRVIVFEKVYESFKELLLAKIKKISVGTRDTDDFGAIISKERFDAIHRAILHAKHEGAKMLCGEEDFRDGTSTAGFFIKPTVFEGIAVQDEIAQTELFGPVVGLFRAKDYDEAIKLANGTQYGLSSAIHTKSIDMAHAFIRDSHAGVVRVNAATHGSEPHMPFGGFGL